MKQLIQEVKQVGQILRNHFFDINPHQEKEPGHLLAQADLEMHQRLCEILNRLYPGVSVDSEEGDSANTGSGFIIDPIDGTNNFLCGRPFFAISIALEEKGEIVLGLIHNPVTGETFYGEKSAAHAFYNGQKIKMPPARPLEESLFFMGLSYGPEKYEAYLKAWQPLLDKARKCFFETAPALSICNVALGRIQGFIDTGCSTYGQSAASLILKLTGGSCFNSDLSEYDHRVKGGVFLSANMKEAVLACCKMKGYSP